MSGFRVDPAELAAGAGELSEASRSLDGVRLDRAAGEPAAAGHHRLARALEHLAHAFDRGIDELADETDELAGRLHAASRIYRGTDDDLAGAFAG